VEQVQNELELNPGDSDVWFGKMIARTSSLITSYIDMPVLTHTVSEVFSRDPTSIYEMNALNGKRFRPLALERKPVQNVVSLSTENGTLIKDVDYIFEDDTGFVFRVMEGLRTTWRERNIAVEYVCGFDTVPDDITNIAMMLITNAYAAKGRDSAIQLEIADGVGRNQYFDRGINPFYLDDASKLVLNRYRASRWTE
jgi:hypothetical protein